MSLSSRFLYFCFLWVIVSIGGSCLVEVSCLVVAGNLEMSSSGSESAPSHVDVVGVITWLKLVRGGLSRRFLEEIFLPS